MQISDFDFELPEQLIAQHPLAVRDGARMLVLDRREGNWRDSRFSQLPLQLEPGDLVVINNTRVFPARLVGQREPSGGRVELLLVEEREPCVWEALARPARRLQIGAHISFGHTESGRLDAEVIEELDNGRRVVRFLCDGNLIALLEQLGHTPLPPYIKRDARIYEQEDRERYQTIYARQRGSIAAPTAGLHFTSQVLRELLARGVEIVEATLHVGYGTFEPVRASDLREHRVAPERYEISAEAVTAINGARGEGRRIIAVGTTTVRALESAADEAGRVTCGAEETQLTITPGYKFRVVDALLTNFHLPRSSLLILAAAFAGRGPLLAAYRHAVEARYRFYSYGDCMLII
ncbi:MAG: tRNA preQ1(34) S-adenosylmethionine ribosyltransferase-isomerase QueA [Pyrinomonadaceae bacterium]|nr:tRNA preQ1(34) S-adenosylmethionine ribosyltransferase-isomerase QueA [Pyrinomonadaceae bacterium]